MINAFNLCRLLWIVVTSAAAVFPSKHEIPSRLLGEQQRHLVRGSTCTLFRKCATYGETTTHPGGHREDSWACKLSTEDSERMNGLQFLDLVESETVAAAISNATSGVSILSMSEAIVDADESRMYVPEHAHVRVQDVVVGVRQNNGISTRKIKTMGILNTLVVRVIDRNGKGPTSNATQLISDIFEDSVSLKTQMEACSYEKLRIDPFRGTTPLNQNIPNGVVDIQIDYDNTINTNGADNAALKAARDALGDLNDPMFDLVMFCFPPNTLEGIAFAYLNEKYSFYSDEWCGYVSSQMHEVGHSLGLGHSGRLDEDPFQKQWGDETGYMGSAHGGDDWSQCYNPQKSYQLGWYEDQVESINPLDGLPLESTLNGVSDYGKNPNALVVLRLEQTDYDEDYYIGYNRATGINANTRVDLNMVTIVRNDARNIAGSLFPAGQSIKVASLSPGQRWAIPDFNGSGKTIQVALVSISDGRDARIQIFEGTDSPSQSPVQAPTTKKPKRARKPNKRCKNAVKRKFRVNANKGRKKSCKQYAKAKQCDKIVVGGKNNGKVISELCRKNCSNCAKSTQKV